VPVRQGNQLGQTALHLAAGAGHSDMVRAAWGESPALPMRVSAGWVSLSSRGVWGGDALLLSARPASNPTHLGLERHLESRPTVVAMILDIDVCCVFVLPRVSAAGVWSAKLTHAGAGGAHSRSR
jgi:ankyrin repeat protein